MADIIDIMAKRYPDLEADELATVCAAAEDQAAKTAAKFQKPDWSALHSQLQQSVWNTLDQYSRLLGWGLTGSQPECWILLDSAIRELLQRRLSDPVLQNLCARSLCGCLSKDCTKHGSYVAGEQELFTFLSKHGLMETINNGPQHYYARITPTA